MFPFPWAPRRAYDASLFPGSGSAFSNNAIANAFGVQSSAHILTRGQSARGLLITPERATYPTDELEGFRVIVEDGSSTTATLDEAGRTLTVTLQSDTTGFNTVKSRIDGITGLASAYFGSESGSGRPTKGETAFAGGTPDEDVVIRLIPDGTGLMFVGSAAPSNADEAVLVRPGLFSPLYRIPAGERVWLRATGSNALDGSIEVWRLGEAAGAFPIPVEVRSV